MTLPIVLRGDSKTAYRLPSATLAAMTTRRRITRLGLMMS